MTNTLEAIRNGDIAIPVPVQLMFGGAPIEPEFVGVFETQPRWDELDIDEILGARCCSL